MATMTEGRPGLTRPPMAPVYQRRRSDRIAGSRTDGLVRALGWFSLALGVAEVVAPETVANLVGVRRVRHPGTVRLLGLREIAGGVGILTSNQPAPWLWARVAGDVMDLAALGMAGDDDADRGRLLASAIAVAGVTALDVYGSRRAGSGNGTATEEGAEAGATAAKTRGIEVRKTITISRPPADVYEFWRKLENLPRFMEYLESVRVLDDTHSSWKAKGPSGSQYEWNAEITEDRPGELIAWRSLPPSDAFNTGVVVFIPAPAEQGTEVHVELRYEPPAGKLGAAVAKLFGKEPGQQVMSDLRRLKQVLEAGEVTHSDASVARGPHPARAGAGAGVEKGEDR